MLLIEELFSKQLSRAIKNHFQVETIASLQSFPDEELLKLRGFGKMALQKLRSEKPEKKIVQTIDVTPTWHSVTKIIRLSLENGTDEGKRIALDTLRQMADICEAVRTAPKETKIEDLFKTK